MLLTFYRPVSLCNEDVKECILHPYQHYQVFTERPLEEVGVQDGVLHDDLKTSRSLASFCGW